jgi:hypothetical protein
MKMTDSDYSQLFILQIFSQNIFTTQFLKSDQRLSHLQANKQ